MHEFGESLGIIVLLVLQTQPPCSWCFGDQSVQQGNYHQWLFTGEQEGDSNLGITSTTEHEVPTSSPLNEIEKQAIVASVDRGD